jgi:hypothetical protein
MKLKVASVQSMHLVLGLIRNSLLIIVLHLRFLLPFSPLLPYSSQKYSVYS